MKMEQSVPKRRYINFRRRGVTQKKIYNLSIALRCDILVVLVKITELTLRRLMSYIYGAPILDVSRSHTTTQHSR